MLLPTQLLPVCETYLHPEDAPSRASYIIHVLSEPDTGARGYTMAVCSECMKPVDQILSTAPEQPILHYVNLDCYHCELPHYACECPA